MSVEAPRQPSTPAEIATQIQLQHVADALHQRGLGETMIVFGKDGLAHALITPASPLPTAEIPHPVVHMAVQPKMTGESMLFISGIEKVDSSIIVGEMVEGFPPVKRAPTEKRSAIGNGSMQINTLIGLISGYLNPLYDIKDAA
jgi:hypothetical protein